MNLKTILVFSLIGLLFFVVFVLYKYVNIRVGNIEDYIQKLGAPAAANSRRAVEKPRARKQQVQMPAEVNEKQQEDEPENEDDESETRIEEYEEDEEEEYDEQELDDILSDDVKQIR